jgi:hypothetical protein
MSEWRENHNGNFVYVDDGVVTTVFQGSDGEWYGIRDGMITEEGFDDSESAMEAIDDEEVEFCEMVGPRDTGWLPAKKGGFYRQNSAGIATVKQASSGKWYVTVNGRMVEGHWLNTKAEAIKLADHLLC